MKKAALATLLVLAIALGGFGYYDQIYLPAQATPEPAYNTTKVRTGDITISAAGVGSILPSEKLSVGFLVSGVLAEVNVAVGDTVEAGQVIARLDDTDAQLSLHQAELDLNSFYSPNTIQEAEIARLDAKAALDDAELYLEYLISAPVYYWERRLVEAQAALEGLKTSGSASESDLSEAQKVIEKAQVYLKSAQGEYYTSYVWEVFPYEYIDEGTEETIYSYLEPTPDAVALARLKVDSARLAMQDAEAFLSSINSSQEGGIETAAYSGTNQSLLDEARLKVDLAQAALEKTIVRAPISGTVTELSASAGQVIGTTPFITIETLDQMSLRFYIEENDINMVKIGSPVVITFEAYPDVPFAGTVTYLEPAIQLYDGSPAAVLWASLDETPDQQLLSGMSAEVEIISGQAEDALLVPVQALRELAPNSYAVFVVQPDGSLKMTPVTVGLQDYANAQILSGLNAGDVVSTGTVETK